MKAILIFMGVAILVSGCAIQPVAFSPEQHLLRIKEDNQRLYDEQEPLVAPLALHDAIARALRYNMDYRVRMMEQAVSLGQTELANYDLLPKLTATAGYSTRNNDAFGFGYTPAGTVSATPSAASPRNHSYDNLTFSWNVLDFGVSYFRARQLADQALIAEERRRKAVQNLVQDVRTAWWRVEAAQRLLPEIDAILIELDRASARAKLIETRKLLPPLQIIAFKRALLDIEQQISLRRQELDQAKEEMAQLLNLRPGQDFSVKPAANMNGARELTASMEALESIAVQNRPELREEGYRARITDLEGSRQWLQLLPSLPFDFGTNHDSNRYLVNNNWSSAGLSLSWNLMRIASLPSLNRSQQAAADVDSARRLAMLSAVLGQTRIAAVRYRLLAQELAIWDDAVADDSRIVSYLQASKQVGLETEMELMRGKGRQMLSKINRDLVNANLQSAVGRLFNSLGLDGMAAVSDLRAADELPNILAREIQAWEDANFSERPAVSYASVAVAAVSGLSGDDSIAYLTSLRRILTLAKFAVVADETSATYRILSQISLQAQGDTGQPVRLSLALVDSEGMQFYRSDLSTMLVTPVSQDQWRALGEGAGYKAIEPLRAYLTSTESCRPTGRDVQSIRPVVSSASDQSRSADSRNPQVKHGRSLDCAESSPVPSSGSEGDKNLKGSK